ncbi:hypothetical protein E2C01_095888 [Portunus trituberculatus]|uniref:Uncharacterized protein n=1 Tax=Portunus trituberculatus TaxID=210409 RepID=A0A5B7K1K6_PORTR|nr:hypothetical protein [Portunus trituberculatus]
MTSRPGPRVSSPPPLTRITGRVTHRGVVNDCPKPTLRSPAVTLIQAIPSRCSTKFEHCDHHSRLAVVWFSFMRLLVFQITLLQSIRILCHISKRLQILLLLLVFSISNLLDFV